jgi:hypothetical protein
MCFYFRNIYKFNNFYIKCLIFTLHVGCKSCKSFGGQIVVSKHMLHLINIKSSLIIMSVVQILYYRWNEKSYKWTILNVLIISHAL